MTAEQAPGIRAAPVPLRALSPTASPITTCAGKYPRHFPAVPSARNGCGHPEENARKHNPDRWQKHIADKACPALPVSQLFPYRVGLATPLDRHWDSSTAIAWRWATLRLRLKHHAGSAKSG